MYVRVSFSTIVLFHFSVLQEAKQIGGLNLSDAADRQLAVSGIFL